MICIAAIASVLSPGGNPAPLTKFASTATTNAPRTKGIDVDAIVKRAHFAFRDDEEADAWTGGDTSYRSRVEADGAIGVRATDGATTSGTIRFATRGILRGSRAVARGVDAIQRDEEGRIAIARGRDVTERVSNTANGVEEAWEIAARPAGRGDLVVRVDVDGARFAGQTRSGLHFTDDTSRLGLAYGAATWIDARGVKSDVAMSYADGAIALRVDAAVVDASTYPVVLDPTIGSEVAIDEPVTVPAPASYPCIAFDGTNDLVCWADSRTNSAVICERVNPSTGQPVAGDTFGHVIGPSSGSSVDAKYDGTNYLVAWLQSFSSGQTVATARVDPATGAAVPDDVGGVLLGGSYLESSPRVATDGTDFLVVWGDGRPQYMYGARVSGATGRAFSDDVGGRLLGGIQNQTSENQQNPAVAFDGTNYALAYVDDYPDPSNNGTYDYYFNARLITPLTGNPITNVTSLAQISGSGTSCSPDLAFDGTSFVFTWYDGPYGSPTAYARRFSATALAPIGTATNLGPITNSGSIRVAVTPAAEVFVWYGSNTINVRTTDLTLTPRASTTFPLASNGNGYVNAAWDGSKVSVVWTDVSQNVRTVEEGRIDPSTGLVATGGSAHAISQATNEEYYPQVACDSVNCLVIWVDNRSGTYAIYGARVAQATQTTLASDAAGLMLMPYTSYPGTYSNGISLVFDGTNYFFVWQTYNTIYGARVDPTSATVLDPSGILVTGNNYYYGTGSAPGIAVGGSNYFVVWSAAPEYNPMVEFARVDRSSGIVLGPGAHGNTIATTSGQQISPAADYDGSNFLVVWADTRGGSTARIYAGRVNPVTGLTLDGDGVALSTSLFAESNPQVAFDGTQHLVVWTDTRNDPSHGDVYGARLTTSTANGITVSTIAHDLAITAAAGDQRLPTIAYTNDGLNFVTLWEDFRAGNYDIYSTLVGGDGTVRDPNGLAIAATTDSETSPRVAAGATNGSLFTVYQRLDSSAAFGSNRARGIFFSSGVAIASSCTTDLDCATRNCADGVCCNEACDGPCQTCSATSGTCTTVTNADDPDTCAATCDPNATSCQAQSSCNANGSCTLLSGAFATSAAECLSGFLVEGVCCDTACDQGCGTCTASGSVGTCSPLVKGSNGVNGACVADGGADIYCDGVGVACPSVCTVDAQCPSGYFCGASKKCTPQIQVGDACDPTTDCATKGSCIDCAAGTTCAVATCDSDAGSARVSAASGAGTCVPAVDLQTTSCGGFGCDGAQCKKTCATSADCAANFTCSVTTQTCVQTATCFDPHTVEDVGGTKTDCAPYVCTAGTCGNRCTSVTDCVNGYACNPNGTCVTAMSVASTPTTPGCSCELGPRRSSTALFPIGIALGLVFARRARRSRTAR